MQIVNNQQKTSQKKPADLHQRASYAGIWEEPMPAYLRTPIVAISGYFER